MAYIGSSPAEKGIGLFSQDTFTGDGSTTTFDLTHAAPDAGGNEIQVFVDNVRQQEGSSNAYTLGLDGSSENKRITFTTAPAASQSIFVLNPGTKNVQQISTVGDNTITTAKLQALAVSKAKIAADAIDATKLADDAISEEHLDVTAITGNTELSAAAADDDVLLVFDTSSSTIKKIQRSNVALSVPTFSSVSPSNLLTGDGTGNFTIVVTGTKFDTGATFKLVTDGGTDISMDSVTRNSATQLTGVVAKSTANLTNANEPFDIVITNSSGLSTTSANALNINASPVYVTGAGTLGTLTGGSAMSTIDVIASDPESAGNVTFELQSGSLPAGVSTATVNENGVSKFRITGTPTNPAAGNTTSNFVLRAVDAASNTTSRAFAITVNRTPQRQSFTSSGTFAVPSGMTSLSAVLVVAGGGQGARAHGSTGVGGGGAGGLIYMPAVTVTPGGTIAVTVGDASDGAAGTGTGTTQGTKGNNSVFGASPSPGISAALTAVGGGAGTVGQCSTNPSDQDGGSGGGGGYGRGGGTAQQPTQPGNSGAYGFGSAGGSSAQTGPGEGGAGGGGAGGVGGQAGASGPSTSAGAGGVGKAYTIADGTTSVFYAGGGGGTGGGPSGPNGSGGQGGGSDGSISPGSQDATANRGGGSGGTRGDQQAGAGGKGIVIVEY
jgi:hypothetical protein